MKDSLQTAPATTAFPHPARQAFNPKAILESLPDDATPAQQDSAIQAHLPQRERFRSACPDTLNLPGWHIPSGQLSLSSLDISYQRSLFESSPYYHPEIPYRPSGFISAPAPYLLRQDHWITGILLCCFLLTLWIFSFERNLLTQRLRNFFTHRVEKGKNLLSTTGQEMRHALFFYLQNGLLTGLFFLIYTRHTQDLFMPRTSPYLLLAAYTLICWVFLGVRQLAYHFINWIFFNKEARSVWMKSYSFLISAEGILFLPLALIMVFSNLSIHHLILSFCILLIFIRLLIFYKSFSLFFPKIHGFLHLIVYFCAFELLPLCGLWQALTYTNDILL